MRLRRALTLIYWESTIDELVPGEETSCVGSPQFTCDGWPVQIVLEDVLLRRAADFYRWVSPRFLDIDACLIGRRWLGVEDVS